MAGPEDLGFGADSEPIDIHGPIEIQIHIIPARRDIPGDILCEAVIYRPVISAHRHTRERYGLAEAAAGRDIPDFHIGAGQLP